MKLLTAGGFLYASVFGQNADGTFGLYENLDWVAHFPETQNTSLTTTNMNVGWDPMVTAVMTSYDGGKVMGGFGKLSGTLYGSWVMKMWGVIGTGPCAANAAISGYVTMKTSVSAATTNTDCALSADAKV